MIINHNIAALNTYRQLNVNGSNSQKNIEKLSSGLRINRAGDDAAGLAISEKMRGQIRGLDQASRNSQDGISMIQTAEGALSETHSILQRMKELATQAANGTNTDNDRAEIQKEINQLSSEINRIGNTTEFNTQSLLKGDGKTDLAASGLIGAGLVTASGTLSKNPASQAFTGLQIASGVTADNSIKLTLNGKDITINLKSVTSGGPTAGNTAIDAASVTDSSVTINYNATAATVDIGASLASAVNQVLAKNSDLAGNFKATSGSSTTFTIAAVAGSSADGAAGAIALPTVSVNTAGYWGTALTLPSASVGTTTDVKANIATTTLAAITSVSAAQDLLGKGFTINGKQIEFYNADAGAYKGDAIGINISPYVKTGATVNAGDITNAIVEQANGKIDGVTLSNVSNELKVTATAVGADGNGIKITDGGIQQDFKSTFQVGANQGQSFAIDLKDMRSKALGITGTTSGGAAANNAVFTKVLDVTNGTDDTSVEYALDVSTTTNASNAIKVLDNAINNVSAERSKLGAYQNRLEHTINNLNTSSENLTAAESRIRDVDMAKEMMEFTKNNILSQAAQAMLAQANQQPQGVLQLLR